MYILCTYRIIVEEVHELCITFDETLHGLFIYNMKLQHFVSVKKLINDWSAILLCLPCIIFHEYMCGFLLFTEFWCFTTRFSSCYKIWL